MNIRILIGKPGLSMSNILWDVRPPPPLWARKGEVQEKLHPTHPCYGDPEPTVFSPDEQPPHDGPLGRFRALGYFASCFPEGDGISFRPLAPKTVEQIANDVCACFKPDSWTVRIP